MVLAVNGGVEALTLSMTTTVLDGLIACYNWPCLVSVWCLASSILYFNLQKKNSASAWRPTMAPRQLLLELEEVNMAAEKGSKRVRVDRTDESSTQVRLPLQATRPLHPSICLAILSAGIA
eukprot:scaffold8168_cov93-Isochrysis_galbana.AAC.1